MRFRMKGMKATRCGYGAREVLVLAENASEKELAIIGEIDVKKLFFSWRGW